MQQPMSHTTAAPHWKTAALRNAEVITDAWEVAKAYAGRGAEWVLFLCMIANIIAMLPGMAVPVCLSDIVLGVQVVMLDIGGMALGTMATHMREQGNKEAAKKADTTSRFLIGLMILTLLLVSIGVLFPAVKLYTDMAEKGLILVRVVMTVVYSHVIHSLRGSHSPAAVPAPPPDVVPENAALEILIRNILVPVLEQYRTEITSDAAKAAGQAVTASLDYAQLAAALQPHIGIQAVQQAPLPQESDPPALRLLPAPSLTAGNTGYAEREQRLEAAYLALVQEGIRPTGQALASRARCNRAAALAWLKHKGTSDEGTAGLKKQA